MKEGMETKIKLRKEGSVEKKENMRVKKNRDEKEREREREREETDRQTDRQTDRGRDRERHTHRQTGSLTDRETERVGWREEIYFLNLLTALASQNNYIMYFCNLQGIRITRESSKSVSLLKEHWPRSTTFYILSDKKTIKIL